MSTEFGINYEIKSGDSLYKIAKKNKLPSWLSIYNHPKNIKFKNKYPDPEKIKAGEVIWVPSSSIIQVKTGNAYGFGKTAWKIFCNGHMHIQSNNCCPLPLQWGIIGRSFVCNRKTLAGILAKPGSFLKGRLGKIGRLNTGVVAGVYMGTARNKDMKKKDAWIVISEEKWDKNAEKQGEAKTTEQVGETAEISKLSEDTIANFDENFIKQTEYYYRNSQFCIMSTALLMDMSLGHYWGKLGIPVCFEASKKFIFINDFIKAGISNRTTKNTSIPILVLCSKNVKHPCRQTGDLQHLYAKNLDSNEFSFKETFKNFEDAQSNKDEKSKNIFMYFEDYLSKNRKLTKRPFVHLIQELPGDEQKWFEEYKKQIIYSEGAAVKFPLKIILFYHYDPRRHCKKGKENSKISELANTIARDHAFYSYRLDTNSWKNENSDIIVKNRMVVTPHPEMNTENFWVKCLEKTIFDNQFAFDKIFIKEKKEKTGIFWGIKTYPRLGYSPDDFKNYPQLEDLYRFCDENKIPIMTHCSRGGMNIADYYCYTRYDSLKKREKYDIKEQEFGFADTFTAPGNWEQVLANYNNLKLCLAHFGGYDAWTGVGSFETIEDKKNFPPNPIELPTKEKPEGNEQEKKVQRASIYHTWIRSIPEMMDRYKNLYVDISYFHLPEKKVKNWKELGWDQKYTISQAMAKNFLFLLQKYPKLKERIIIGTDWPMTEQEKEIGIGTILSRLFHLMSIISKDLNYDAWHQFAVINPLQYLGLLDKIGKGYKVKIEKLEKYVEKLKKMSSSSDWQADAQCFVNSNDVEDNASAIIKKLKNAFIPDSAFNWPVGAHQPAVGRNLDPL